jgi:metacaspase-1
MPNAISLNIGLNAVDPRHYGGWSGALNACEADASDMADIAAVHGMAVTTLLTDGATRDATLAALRTAAARLGSGDFFFLTYSGHGGQVPDAGGDEFDNQDETWCLFDGQMLDDEIDRELSRFAENVRILVLSDSCHSGTVVKAAFYANHTPFFFESRVAPKVFRAMPNNVALSTYRKNRAFYDSIAGALGTADHAAAVRASVILISGCQDNQLSGDGVFNGVFTARLREVWADGAFQGDYREFHARILMGMPPDQSPNFFTVGRSHPAFEQQRPFTV